MRNAASSCHDRPKRPGSISSQPVLFIQTVSRFGLLGLSFFLLTDSLLFDAFGYVLASLDRPCYSFNR